MSDSDDDPGMTKDVAASYEPDVSFQTLGVCDTLCKACEALRWKVPTKIQQQAIPVALQGHDIIGLAETGSGKTAAFAIPILQDLLEKQKKIFALILTPTRELAFQISEQFSALGAYMGATTSVIVGGVDMMTQSIALAKRPHIIVATPGRLADHLKTTKGFSLKSLHYLVMDEADRILNMDYGQAVDLILRNSPSDRKTYLFSATMTQKVEKLQRASLKNPIKIEVASKYQTVDTLLQYYLFIPAIHKDAYLIYLLTENNGSSIIVFTSTCKNTMRLAVMLRYLNFTAIPLNGQLNQTKRIYCLNEFKSKSRSILIATDVASRGLDIPHVDVIINYDVPTRSKDYIHRVGRTARAGRHGKAITLVTQYDVELYQRIEFLLQKKLPLYPTVKEEVEVFYDTVAEAQQLTNTKLKSMEGRKGKKRQLNMDDLDDTEQSLGVRRTLNRKRKRR